MSDKRLEESSYGTGKKKLSIYLVGMALCVVFTLIPFMVVMHDDSLSDAATYSIIFISALIQFLVQVICFLRLNTETEQGRMNVMVFVLTLVILFAVVAGSLWIMWSLRYFMSH